MNLSRDEFARHARPLQGLRGPVGVLRAVRSTAARMHYDVARARHGIGHHDGTIRTLERFEREPP